MMRSVCAARALWRSAAVERRSMSTVIGIDLGTTNSCVAVMEGADVRVLENEEGQRTTPSYVAFTDNGVLVGTPAKRQAVTNPSGTIFAAKRLIGRRFDDVKHELKGLPYKICDHNGDAWVTVKGKEYSPSQIAAHVLTKMKQTAETDLNASVSNVVITVPAYFDDSQRQATKDAGRIAGLNVMRVINEPTAAALAYGLDPANDGQTIAVYDLGGGTFDISILEIDNQVFQVRSTNGDTALGGEDFDRKIVNFLAEQFKNQSGVDVSNDLLPLSRLWEAAEKAKRELSSSSSTDVNLPYLAMDADGPKHLELAFTRKELYQLVGPLVKRTLEPVQKCLDDAKLSKSDVNTVLLVGGMTRMPKVQETVESFFGKKANQGVNPDEVVASGAAIQGAVILGNVKDVVLLDVTPLTLGTTDASGSFVRMIERNTSIPARHKKSFTTVQDMQPAVTFDVRQGERAMGRDNKLLGEFTLGNLPPAPKGVPSFEVTFDVDHNGIVHVTARDKSTGEQRGISVRSNGGLSDAEIEQMIQDAEQNKQSDEKRKRLMQLQEEGRSVLYSAEKAKRDYADAVNAKLKEELEVATESLKAGLEKDDIEETELEATTEAVKKLTMKIGEAVYKNSGASAE